MTDQTTSGVDSQTLLMLTAKIVSAYAGKAKLTQTELNNTIASVATALRTIGSASAAPEKKALVPAVPVKKSVTPDFIICLEDGKKLRMLKRHLMATYNLTPEQYREKWGLPRDYPMVAPNYAAKRSQLAKKIGLGKGTRSPSGAKPATRRGRAAKKAA